MLIQPGVNRDVVGEVGWRGDIERLEQGRNCIPVRLRPLHTAIIIIIIYHYAFGARGYEAAN